MGIVNTLLGLLGLGCTTTMNPSNTNSCELVKEEERLWKDLVEGKNMDFADSFAENGVFCFDEDCYTGVTHCAPLVQHSTCTYK